MSRRDAVRILLGITSDFHFEGADSLRCPLTELLLDLGNRVGSETTASVNRDTVPYLSQELHQRHVEQLRLEVPESVVDSGNRAGRNALPADVPHIPHHDAPAGLD